MTIDAQTFWLAAAVLVPVTYGAIRLTVTAAVKLAVLERMRVDICRNCPGNHLRELGDEE